jgi:hypothetical protein
MMFTVVVVGLVLLVGVLGFFWFMGTPAGLQLVHKQTVNTVLSLVEARRKSAPQERLNSTYKTVAQSRNVHLAGVQRETYLRLLSEAGCFRENPVMSPEEFAEAVARVEDFIKLKKNGALNT